MWLATAQAAGGVSPTGIVSIVVAALAAIGTIGAAYARGRSRDAADPTVVINAAGQVAETAAEAYAKSAEEIYEEELRRERRESEDRDRQIRELTGQRDTWMRRAYESGWRDE